MATMTLRKRVRQLEADKPKVEAKIIEACRNATMRAVEKAMELTPPTQNDLAGTNTRTGEMKQHWVTDSKIDPQVSGGKYTTELNNDKTYASYVNDGHRVDRHFVPGLYVNPNSGLLEYDPSANVGIVVGTKTKYVKGLYMADKAKEEYRRVLRIELGDIGEVLE